MMESVVSAAGVIPAIIFPGAALVQLMVLLKRGHAHGVSVVAWWMFAAANLCLYVYAEKYFEVPAILAFLGTAVLNIAVALTAMRLKKAEKVLEHG